MTGLRLKRKGRLATAAALVLGACGGARGELGADRLVVVYNSSVAESEALARHYAAVRGVPEERVLGLACSGEESITRDIFEASVANPIDRFLQEGGWLTRTPQVAQVDGETRSLMVAEKNDIWGLVLCHGVPLRILHDTNLVHPTLDARFQSTTAAVDSELAALPVWGVRPNGASTNPFFGSRDRFGERWARRMLLVARLDGPSAAVARARLDEALAAERTGLLGRAYFDGRGIGEGGYKAGDDWIKGAAEAARAAGFPTELDWREPVVGAEGLWSDVALYAGWYAGDIAGAAAGPGFRFRPGGVGYHIHSFSAVTLRSAARGWAGPLVARGAAATMGSVEEPYLMLTPQVDAFFGRLLEGWTFGEAAYASQRVLSWTITVVGDPLYRPFPADRKAWLADGLAKRDAPAWPWFFHRELLRRKLSGEVFATGTAAETAAENSADPVLLEIVADYFAETFDRRRAARFYAKAAEAAAEPARVRCLLKRVSVLGAMKQQSEAWAELTVVWRGLAEEAYERGAVLAAAREMEEVAGAGGVPEFWMPILHPPPPPPATNAPPAAAPGSLPVPAPGPAHAPPAQGGGQGMAPLKPVGAPGAGLAPAAPVKPVVPGPGGE